MPPMNLNSPNFQNTVSRSRSVIPSMVSIPGTHIGSNSQFNPYPSPQPPIFNSSTTMQGGTTKTITTEVKPGRNRVVEEIVTTTTIEPRVLEIPLVTKIINETVQVQPPRPPSPIKQEQSSHVSKVIIK